ncbi:MAG TPA: proton-conducting transporter membrane subunit, partial [Candidatus Binataceae bacterium]|nr:proton-conducting transporter membrane subunit [Candidatus Binataceae bacterium]
MNHALTLITFIPLVGMVLILAMPDAMRSMFKWVALIATIPQLLIAWWLFDNFDTTTSAIQFAEKHAWMPHYNITYFMGVDGISISMILLTALISFIAVLASFKIEKGPKAYFALLLLLDTGMMGVFASLDFFLFYVFWEVMLLPMYFLIGIWGGPRREYAAIKFFLYTLLGSVLMLLAMLGLYYYGSTPTFDMTVLAANAGNYTMTFQRWAWVALFIGFAIK